MRQLISRASLAALTLLALGYPGEAAACGGTFCDRGPTAMPVDQTGENIVFVMDAGFVEAHVQIQYSGDPARFAWIVPMQKVPETHVGSSQLFTNLLAATVPTYGFTSQFDQCDQQLRVPGANFSAGAGGASSASDKGVQVVYQKTVGAFVVTVLTGGSADEVVQWLDTNGYQGIDTAPAILQRYLDKKFVFAAVKLTAGAGINEIHPLVFRYAGTEPCVPLELTAVAAVDDMNVRAFFFGSERVVPENYRHVVLNPLKIDWLNRGANYDAVVSSAVDTRGADGQAFITEYAGSSRIVPSQGLTNPSWSASRFTSATPQQAMAELGLQGLMSCSTNFCSYNHPLILPLLQEFLPRPTGVSDEQYYSCLAAGTTTGASPCAPPHGGLSGWVPAEFARALDERIFQPALHAADILRTHPYLSRLFTRISPFEMTLDPIFKAHAGLPPVALPGLAVNQVHCNGSSLMQLPTGELVALGSTGQWPAFGDMPSAALIEDFSSGSSQPALVGDNAPKIETALKAHNQANGLNGTSVGCGCDVPGRTGSAPPAPLALGAALGALGLARGLRRRRGPA
jgi:hypothetical protein